MFSLPIWISSSDYKWCCNQSRNFNTLFASGIFEHQLIKPDSFKLLATASLVYAACAPHAFSVLRGSLALWKVRVCCFCSFLLCSVLLWETFSLLLTFVFFTGLRNKCKLRFCALWLNGELSEKNNVCGSSGAGLSAWWKTGGFSLTSQQRGWTLLCYLRWERG